MRVDCVVGETGEQGRHFRGNLAGQHLPPSLAGDRRGTAGRRRRRGERGREGGREVGLTLAFTTAPLKLACARARTFSVHALSHSLLEAAAFATSHLIIPRWSEKRRVFAGGGGRVSGRRTLPPSRLTGGCREDGGGQQGGVGDGLFTRRRAVGQLCPIGLALVFLLVPYFPAPPVTHWLYWLYLPLPVCWGQ